MSERFLNKKSHRPSRRFSRPLIISNFVVTKRTGGLRLRSIFFPLGFQDGIAGSFVTPSFERDWAVTLDLRDAYLLCPDSSRSRRLLGFCFGEFLYRYQVLPFGLRDSPRMFSRLEATIVIFLRQNVSEFFSFFF